MLAEISIEQHSKTVIGVGTDGEIDARVPFTQFRLVDIENTARCIVWPMLMANLWTQSLGIYAEHIDLIEFRKTHYDLLLRGLTFDGAAERTPHE